MLSGRNASGDGKKRQVWQGKELQKLKRQDLLELLVEQLREADRLRRAVAQRDELLAEERDRVERLKGKLDAKDEAIARLEGRLNAKDQRIAHLVKEHAELLLRAGEVLSPEELLEIERQVVASNLPWVDDQLAEAVTEEPEGEDAILAEPEVEVAGAEAEAEEPAETKVEAPAEAEAEEPAETKVEAPAEAEAEAEEPVEAEEPEVEETAGSADEVLPEPEPEEEVSFEAEAEVEEPAESEAEEAPAEPAPAPAPAPEPTHTSVPKVAAPTQRAKAPRAGLLSGLFKRPRG